MPYKYSRLVYVAIAALALFALLATQVGRGSAIASMDIAFARGLDGRSTPAGQQVFRFITLLGTGWTLGVASGIVALGLLLRRHFSVAVAWIVAQGGIVLLVKLVKLLVERDRPGLGDTTFYAHGWSFPSGHVARTFVFCAMAAYLVFRLSRSRIATRWASAVAITWTLIMAFSRLYLGAHFASDVIAALLLATAWVALCIAGSEAWSAAPENLSAAATPDRR
jgi:undecaprenyl-diphosphatase